MKAIVWPAHGMLWVALGVCLAPQASAQLALSQLTPGDTVTVAEQYLLSAANQERAAAGLKPLHRDPLLARAAAQHARQMAAHAGISHQFPGEAELTARAAANGVHFSVASENVGEAPSVIKMHVLWMNSEHHRDNLLDPAVDAMGISVIARGRELYAVEDFARTVRTYSLVEQESAIASLLAQPGALAVDLSPTTTNAARQTCAMETGYAGTRKPWFVMRFTSDTLSVLPGELKERLATGRFHQAAVGACPAPSGPFTAYNLAVLLYP
jgi:uncharacterized protein YkwD